MPKYIALGQDFQEKEIPDPSVAEVSPKGGEEINPLAPCENKLKRWLLLMTVPRP
jgi:hypothetical protein